jgi:hypothetical protein
MQKVFYYVGSNNKTGKLEIKKIEELLSQFFEGFTTYEVVGHWKGQRERTLKIEIVTDLPATKLVAVAKELKTALDQEAVLMEIIESNAAFVQ